jgi:hypothetical protein
MTNTSRNSFNQFLNQFVFSSSITHLINFLHIIMSSQRNKVCKGCHVLRNYEEFLNEKGVALKKCLRCRDEIKTTRSKKNKPQPDMISHLDITETLYTSLISLENVNEFYEGENEELNLTFNIELSSLHNVILENGGSNKENIEHEIGHYIINFISESDGYSWIYHKKIQKESSFHIIYYCNCRIELRKRKAKHPDLDKQRDMPAYLERYHCEGVINII